MKPRRPRHTKTRAAAVAAGFRSGFEAAIAKDLDQRGIKYEYEKSTLVYLRKVRGGKCGECKSTNVCKQSSYVPDFKLANGLYIEAKGRFTASDRAKMVAVRLAHTGVRLALLFQADNYTTKLKRERYSGWATRHKFTFTVARTVPQEWTV